MLVKYVTSQIFDVVYDDYYQQPYSEMSVLDTINMPYNRPNNYYRNDLSQYEQPYNYYRKPQRHLRKRVNHHVVESIRPQHNTYTQRRRPITNNLHHPQKANLHLRYNYNQQYNNKPHHIDYAVYTKTQPITMINKQHNIDFTPEFIRPPYNSISNSTRHKTNVIDNIQKPIKQIPKAAPKPIAKKDTTVANNSKNDTKNKTTEINIQLNKIKANYTQIIKEYNKTLLLQMDDYKNINTNYDLMLDINKNIDTLLDKYTQLEQLIATNNLTLTSADDLITITPNSIEINKDTIFDYDGEVLYSI